MNIRDISPKIKNERQLRAVSGVSMEQFFILLVIFEANLNLALEAKNKNKTRKQGSGKKGDIETPSEKLLLILHYLKCYSTFDHLGFTFGISGSSASQYVYNLFPILVETLKHFNVLPHIKFNTPEEMKEAFSGFDTLLIDATERAVDRPQDNDLQQESYSGKKKQNTDKVTVISTLTRYILYIGVIFKGKNQDYGMFKKEFNTSKNWFETFNIYIDLGYLGFANDYKTKSLFIPYKKDKKSKKNLNQN